MSNDVFFLGAGFSAAVAGISTMNELSQQVHQKILGDFKESIVNHYQTEIPEQLKKNIEALLSYLSADLPWKSKVQQYENLALYEKIVEKIVDVISSEASNILSSNILYNSGEFHDFFEKIMQSKNSIISLNYDVLCENFIQGIDGLEMDFSRIYKVPITYVGKRVQGGGYDRRPTKSGISLIKLHGSINWKWCGLSDSDPIYFCGKGLSVNMHAQDEEQSSAGLRTCIVPPVMDKSAFYKNAVLRSLWEIAERKLQEAENIYIIGFSFPPSDLSVRFLFQSALRKNKAKIAVVNCADKKELEKNYKDVFGEKRINYKYTGKMSVFHDFVRDFIKK